MSRNQNRSGVKLKKTVTNTLLDKMVEGREYASIVQYDVRNLDINSEIRKSLTEIESIRNRPVICYLANVVNQQIKASRSIDYSDDLPFSEMVSSIDDSIKEIDVIIVTPGGSGEQVSKFVDKLRPRFENVTFILPDIAMSAGTILAMSGNDIIMSSNSYIGPIDPQVQNKDGKYVPAQSLLTLIDEIREKGEPFIQKKQNPPWTDLQILNQIDKRDIGAALNASKYSIELVEKYLYEYKFQNWDIHRNGNTVTEKDKKERAHSIAETLCNHQLWKTHGRGITREEAWSGCQLKIIFPESITGLDTAIRRFWALIYYIFENTAVYKLFFSRNYVILRNDTQLIK